MISAIFVDRPRLEQVVSEGYLDDEDKEWDQPEDRILWSWRRYFKNDDLKQGRGTIRVWNSLSIGIRKALVCRSSFSIERVTALLNMKLLEIIMNTHHR